MDKYLSDRAISENLLLEKLSRMIDYCQKDKSVNAINALFQMGDAIMDCSTVDTVPVVHGRWKTVRDEWGDDRYQCSVCGEEWAMMNFAPFDYGMKYCPNCGAKMFSE